MRIWTLLPVLLFVPMLLAPPINHDVAGILTFAQRMVDGERLYLDLVDVNPPLIFLLNWPPAALAAWLGLDAIRVLQAFLFAFVALAWGLALLVRDRASECPAERCFLDLLPGLIGLACGYDFGQRETLMVTASLPYLLASARRADGARPRAWLAATVLAAIGFALKPHFLIIPVLVEISVWMARGRNGWRDPTPWVMMALWGAYAGVIFAAFPAYPLLVVPMARAAYLANGGLSVFQVLLQPRMATAVAVLLPGAVAAFLWPRAAGLARMLALAGLGALASALIQHKGWSYHIVPVELYACALTGLLACRLWDRRLTPPLLAALFALYAMLAGEAPRNQWTYRQSDAHRLTEELRRAAPGGRVLVLSPLIAPIYPALNYAHARMTLRAMNTWMLEGAYPDCAAPRDRAPRDMPRAEGFLWRSVLRDFTRAPPDAVVVDLVTGVPDCGAPFDVIAYFSRDPRFAAIWSRYVLVAAWGRFQVFARRD